MQWFEIPVPILESYIIMMNKINANEGLEDIALYRLGSGLVEAKESRNIINNMMKEAGHKNIDKQRFKTIKDKKDDLSMAGIGFRFKEKKDAGN